MNSTFEYNVSSCPIYDCSLGLGHEIDYAKKSFAIMELAPYFNAVLGAFVVGLSGLAPLLIVPGKQNKIQ